MGDRGQPTAHLPATDKQTPVSSRLTVQLQPGMHRQRRHHQMNPIEARQPRHPELPYQRFHGLLNSLFKVLFTFPSRYLSAIGLAPVFSLGWSLPPTWGCIPKQPDSTSTDPRPAASDFQALRGSHPLWRAVPSQLRARRRWIGTVCLSRPQFARSRLMPTGRFQTWAGSHFARRY